MKTVEEIKKQLEEIKNAVKESRTMDEQLYHKGRAELLKWVLED